MSSISEPSRTCPPPDRTSRITPDPAQARPELRGADVVLHGRRVHYRTGGRGPAVLLLHGLTEDSGTWDGLVPALIPGHEVIAVDIPGHGRSAKPRCDYSPAALANILRDLLVELGHRQVTVVGHSFGGGLAAQLAYQFPGLVDRLVLVASGGLGHEVSRYLRVLSLPGAPTTLALLGRAAALAVPALRARPPEPITAPRRSPAPWSTVAAGRAHARRFATLVQGGVRAGSAMGDPESRNAFARTLRTVIDVWGQRIDGTTRVHTFRHLPALLVWGDADRVIPCRHGVETVRDVWPDAVLHLVPGAGHFVHRDHHEEVGQVVRCFLEQTGAAPTDGVHELVA